METQKGTRNPCDEVEIAQLNIDTPPSTLLPEPTIKKLIAAHSRFILRRNTNLLCWYFADVAVVGYSP